MPASDPFAALGLGPDASAEDIQSARRRLAMAHHPDRGGDPALMQTINEAADAALSALDRGGPSGAGSVPDQPMAPPRRSTADATGIARDVPSFTVEALPVETFEAMLVVASWLGEVLDDDPPYRLDTYLSEPLDCWCRLEVVPDAGASTVSLSVAGLDGAPTPDVLAVRDAWVANLNALDWP
jgi:DnaJ domain